MKKYLSLLLITFITPLTASILEFMTRNVRRMGDDPVEHLWNNRRQLVFDQIITRKPAVIGFQEVVVGQQLEDLKKGLSDYISIGDIGRKAFTTGWFQRQVGRLDRTKNESTPLFYNPEQVDLVADGTFGINPTGHFFTASLPRMCTWATFKDKGNKKEFTVYNTHLSSSGMWGLKDGNDLIRKKQIGIILKDIKKRRTPSMPVILMGDFNTPFEGAIKKKLTKAGFAHAQEKASIKKGPEATRTGWDDEKLKIIDHILMRGDLRVMEWEVVESPQGQYPSDHRPVCAKIHIR